MFKKVIFGLAVAIAGLVYAGESQADQFVPGHFRSYGTYVQPHFRSNPDGNVFNNYSTYPNVNPYTDLLGSHHYHSYPAPTQFRYHYHSAPYQHSPYRGYRFGF